MKYHDRVKTEVRDFLIERTVFAFNGDSVTVAYNGNVYGYDEFLDVLSGLLPEIMAENTYNEKNHVLEDMDTLGDVIGFGMATAAEVGMYLAKEDWGALDKLCREYVLFPATIDAIHEELAAQYETAYLQKIDCAIVKLSAYIK